MEIYLRDGQHAGTYHNVASLADSLEIGGTVYFLVGYTKSLDAVYSIEKQLVTQLLQQEAADISENYSREQDTHFRWVCEKSLLLKGREIAIKRARVVGVREASEESLIPSKLYLVPSSGVIVDYLLPILDVCSHPMLLVATGRRDYLIDAVESEYTVGLLRAESRTNVQAKTIRLGKPPAAIQVSEAVVCSYDSV